MSTRTVASRPIRHPTGAPDPRGPSDSGADRRGDALRRLRARGRRRVRRGGRAGRGRVGGGPRITSSAAMALTVTLPDGKELELPDGATGVDAAAAIGPGLARAALAVEVSHELTGNRPEVRDLARPLPDGARISIMTDRSGEEALELIRHDAAHVLAAAVIDLYEGVKISIGPSDRGRLLLRLRVPRRNGRLGCGLAEDRRADAGPHQGRRGVHPRGRARRGGAGAVRGRSARTTRWS